MESENGRSNRLFIFVAIALVGLICIGVVATGAFFTITRTLDAQDEAVSVQQEGPTVLPSPTSTNTVTPSATPTETPLPTETATPVVANGDQVAPESSPEPPPEDDGGPDTATNTPESEQPSLPTAQATLDPAQATPTSTLVVGGETATPVANATGSASEPPSEMPEGGEVQQGSDRYLLWAGGMVLVLLIGGFLAGRSKDPASRRL